MFNHNHIKTTLPTGDCRAQVPRVPSRVQEVRGPPVHRTVLHHVAPSGFATNHKNQSSRSPLEANTKTLVLGLPFRPILPQDREPPRGARPHRGSVSYSAGVSPRLGARSGDPQALHVLPAGAPNQAEGQLHECRVGQQVVLFTWVRLKEPGLVGSEG